jgi:two-component system chemotaxis response regulator CheY
MKTLIVEDDFTSRLLLQEILKEFGAVHIAVNGQEAVDAFGNALVTGEPYDLVCLDIMLPGIDGLEALRQIRGMEDVTGTSPSRGTKVIMTTALDHVKSVVHAFRGLCDDYLFKPIDRGRLVGLLHTHGLLRG